MLKYECSLIWSSDFLTFEYCTGWAPTSTIHIISSSAEALNNQILNYLSWTVLLQIPIRNLPLIREHKNKEGNQLHMESSHWVLGLPSSALDELNPTKVTLNPPAVNETYKLCIK